MLSNFFPSRRRVNFWLRRYQLFYPLALIGLLFLDIVSWLGWVYPALASSAVILLVLVWLQAARRDLVLAVGLLILELIVGAQGHLLNFTAGSITISLRLAIFLAAVAVMIYTLWLKRDYIYLLNRSTLWYALALIALTWGFVVGVGRGNSWANLFLDLNGYLYLLLWPLFVIMLRTTIWQTRLTRIIIAGLIWLGIRTVIGFYLFSHFNSAYLLPFYQWWREVGLGEITYISANYFRVFSQSHIWSMLATVAGLALLARAWLERTGAWLTARPIIFVVFNLAVVIISMSRSLWLAAAAAWLIIFLWLVMKKWRRAMSFMAISIIVVLASSGLVMLVNRLAWPPLIGGSTEVLSARLDTGEVAGVSRLNLLPPLLKQIATAPISGRGFGATVTYHSFDPRVVGGTAGGSGIVTTYAFEWGYLDSWLKLGLLGLIAWLSFLLFKFCSNFKRWWHGDISELTFVTPAWLSLLVVNITTPYLNHPLGLGAIMLALAYTLTFASVHDRQRGRYGDW